jgi:hypothetical protein
MQTTESRGGTDFDQEGLQGHFSRSFCVLESSLDVLRQYLGANTTPKVRGTAGQVLDRINEQVAKLERMAAEAVNAAEKEKNLFACEMLPIELAAYLDDFEQVANEELAARGLSCRLMVEKNLVEQTLWVKGNLYCMDGLFVNLIADSLQTEATQIHVVCKNDSKILYSDNGTGTPLLRYERELTSFLETAPVLPKENLNAALVRKYAAALEWHVLPDAGVPGGLCIRIGQSVAPLLDHVLYSQTTEKRRRQERHAHNIRYEFNAAFGGALDLWTGKSAI